MPHGSLMSRADASRTPIAADPMTAAPLAPLVRTRRQSKRQNKAQRCTDVAELDLQPAATEELEQRTSDAQQPLPTPSATHVKVGGKRARDEVSDAAAESNHKPVTSQSSKDVQSHALRAQTSGEQNVNPNTTPSSSGDAAATPEPKRRRIERIGPPPKTRTSALVVPGRFSAQPHADDKDGHYVFEMGENLTARCEHARARCILHLTH